MVLPRAPLLPMAAGGREKCAVSKGHALVLVLGLISVEGAGVGGKLGRGMMGRWTGALMRKAKGRGDAVEDAIGVALALAQE